MKKENKKNLEKEIKAEIEVLRNDLCSLLKKITKSKKIFPRAEKKFIKKYGATIKLAEKYRDIRFIDLYKEAAKKLIKINNLKIEHLSNFEKTRAEFCDETRVDSDEIIDPKNKYTVEELMNGKKESEDYEEEPYEAILYIED